MTFGRAGPVPASLRATTTAAARPQYALIGKGSQICTLLEFWQPGEG